MRQEPGASRGRKASSKVDISSSRRYTVKRCASVSQRRPLLAGRCLHSHEAQTQGHAQEETRIGKLGKVFLQSALDPGRAHTELPAVAFTAALSPGAWRWSLGPQATGGPSRGRAGRGGQTPSAIPGRGWGRWWGEAGAAAGGRCALGPRVWRKMASFYLKRGFLLLRAFSTPGPCRHGRV